MITDYSNVFGNNFRTYDSNSIFTDNDSTLIYDTIIMKYQSTNFGVKFDNILTQYNQTYNIKNYSEALSTLKLDSINRIGIGFNQSTDEFTMIDQGHNIFTNLSMSLKQNVIAYYTVKDTNHYNEYLYLGNKYKTSENYHYDVSFSFIQTAKTQMYLTQIENNPNKYYTILYDVYRKRIASDWYNRVQIKILVIDASHDITLTTIIESNLPDDTYSHNYSDVFGKNFKVVYETSNSNGDVFHYAIGISNIDHNIDNDDKPSDQIVNLWRINISPNFNHNIVDTLDADSENGNNRFNTEVRDANWDTSVQGGTIIPVISEYIQYDEDNQFGLIGLSYRTDKTDYHNITQYFKKYTIDTDNDKLNIEDITVDLNGFSLTYSVPQIIDTSRARLIDEYHALEYFEKNGTIYLVESEQFNSPDKYNSFIRFYKFVDANTLKLLDVKNVSYEGYSTNEKPYFHKTEDHIYHILHRDFKPRRILFNFIDETIEVKEFNYFNDLNNIHEDSVSHNGPVTFTKYYGLAYPNLKNSDHYNSSYAYPLDYNIYNKTELILDFDQQKYMLINDDNSIDVNVKIRDLELLQNITGKVKLYTDVGVFHDNNSNTITVDVPVEGLNVQIDIHKKLSKDINITGEILN